MASPNQTYVSGGQMLDNPPLSARISRSVDNVYNFLGLYFVSLLSLDPYAAAQNSQFNTRSNPNGYQTRPRWGGSSNQPNASTQSPRSNSTRPPPPAPRRPIGTVDDVRAPECGSCQ